MDPDQAERLAGELLQVEQRHADDRAAFQRDLDTIARSLEGLLPDFQEHAVLDTANPVTNESSVRAIAVVDSTLWTTQLQWRQEGDTEFPAVMVMPFDQSTWRVISLAEATRTEAGAEHLIRAWLVQLPSEVMAFKTEGLVLTAPESGPAERVARVLAAEQGWQISDRRPSEHPH